MVIDYISFFMEKFPSYLESSDLKIAYANELGYLIGDNANANVCFTAKQLKGDIDIASVVTYPVQIMCVCDERFVDEIREALDNFAIALNRKVYNVSGHKFRHFYSTSYTYQAIQQDGIRKVVTIACDCTLVSFAGLDIDSFKLNGEELDFQSFAISYTATPSSVGAVPSNLGLNKSLMASASITWSVSFIPMDSTEQKALFRQLAMKNYSLNKQYTLTFTAFNETFTMNAVLQSGGNAKDTGAIPIISAVFTEGDF